MRLFLVVFLLLSVPCQAIVLTISESQLNMAIKPFFPITKSFEGISATFSEPRIVLDALDDTVEIAVTIRAQQGAEYLLAKGKLEGTLEYDGTDQVLHIEEPGLTELDVIENHMQQADEPIRVLRQTIGKRLPVIILIDFNELNIEYLQMTPKEIDITPRGLMVTF